jgi:Restriction endonuclease
MHLWLLQRQSPWIRALRGQPSGAVDPNIKIETVTRPTVDGGRDAIGTYRVGPLADRIVLDFALEAKCYAPGNGVGVKELSRLISRLRHRQFGILVTTSFLGHQAYQELRSDRHPVVVIAGGDIAAILVKAYELVGPLETGRLLESIQHVTDCCPLRLGRD